MQKNEKLEKLMLQEIEFLPDAKPAACWFVGGFIGLLGAGLAFAGLNRVSYEPEWMIPQILFGLAICLLAWRTVNYYRRPVFALTNDAIELKPFWSFGKRIPYSDIMTLGFYDQDNAVMEYSQRFAGRPTFVGRKTGETVTSQHLVVKLKSGEVEEIVLPRYDNSELLEILQKRTKLKYQKLARREAG